MLIDHQTVMLCIKTVCPLCATGDLIVLHDGKSKHQIIGDSFSDPYARQTSSIEFLPCPAAPLMPFLLRATMSTIPQNEQDEEYENPFYGSGDKGFSDCKSKCNVLMSVAGAVEELASWILCVIEDVDSVNERTDLINKQSHVLTKIQEDLAGIRDSIMGGESWNGDTSDLEENIVALMLACSIELPEKKKYMPSTIGLYEVARSVTRRVERKVFTSWNILKSEKVGKYMNRLGDYLFVLAHHIYEQDLKED